VTSRDGVATVVGPARPEDESDQVPGILEIVRMIERGGAQAVPLAIEAIARGEGEWGTNWRFIMPYLFTRGWELEFVQLAEDRILSEMVPEDPRRTKWRLRDAAAVRALLRACLVVRTQGRSAELGSFLYAKDLFHFGYDPEASVLFAQIVCPDSPVRCLESVLKSGICWGPREPCTPAHHVAVRALTDMGNVSFLSDATHAAYAPSVRLEALAALRSLAPQAARDIAAKAATERVPDEEIGEIERLLVEGDPIGVRCEALLILQAKGRTSRVRERLVARYTAEDISDGTRARIEFALRLLRSDKM